MTTWIVEIRRSLSKADSVVSIISRYRKTLSANILRTDFLKKFDSWWHHLLKSKTILIPDFFKIQGFFFSGTGKTNRNENQHKYDTILQLILVQHLFNHYLMLSNSFSPTLKFI
ncbi:hypothetical protein NXV12_02885 [Bacteroides thetaiotaomicron]|nr:hypothetical protein [Bacteroides thetaiotaomicron]